MRRSWAARCWPITRPRRCTHASATRRSRRRRERPPPPSKPWRHSSRRSADVDMLSVSPVSRPASRVSARRFAEHAAMSSPRSTSPVPTRSSAVVTAGTILHASAPVSGGLPKTILPPEGKDAATTARCSSSAPSNSGTDRLLAEVVGPVCEIAEEISRRLGWSGSRPSQAAK